jgi:hypothetical protein
MLLLQHHHRPQAVADCLHGRRVQLLAQVLQQQPDLVLRQQRR